MSFPALGSKLTNYLNTKQLKSLRKRIVADKAGIPAEVKSMDSGRAYTGRAANDKEESRVDKAL